VKKCGKDWRRRQKDRYHFLVGETGPLCEPNYRKKSGKLIRWENFGEVGDLSNNRGRAMVRYSVDFLPGKEINLTSRKTEPGQRESKTIMRGK